MNDWREEAVCRNAPEPDASAFFPWQDGVTKEDVERVRDSYCGACPVREECLEFAVETESLGIWGGINITNKNCHKIYSLWNEGRLITSEDEEDAR